VQTVGIKTLKNKLSAYLRIVAAGETVQVTDRGRVVAEIVPPRAETKATTPEERWAELIRQGHVRPAKIPPDARLPPRQEAVMTLEELMREIGEDRADR
jgi:prevent-host-death family protein